MSLIHWLSAGAIAGFFTASGAMVADFRVTYAAENDANQLLSEAHGIFSRYPTTWPRRNFPLRRSASI